MKINIKYYNNLHVTPKQFSTYKIINNNKQITINYKQIITSIFLINNQIKLCNKC